MKRKSREAADSRYVKMAHWAYTSAKAVYAPYSHPKSPHRFTQPQLAACVVLMMYLDISYRDMEEWLLAATAVCAALELDEIPDHSTLSRMTKRMTQGRIEQMITAMNTALQLEPETIVITDSTSFSTRSASAYFVTKTYHKYRQWVKGGYLIGLQSPFIRAVVSQVGAMTDYRLFAALRRKLKGIVVPRRWMMMADRGFDARQVQPTHLIPPVRRNGKLLHPKRIARHELVQQAQLDGLYGKRWWIETTHSVIKRLMGGAVRARSHRLRLREPFLKAFAYNCHL